MSSKTDTEVIIGGKIFTLSGYESEEYLQRVASYINNKLEEYSKIESFRRQPMDTQSVLMQLTLYYAAIPSTLYIRIALQASFFTKSAQAPYGYTPVPRIQQD